MAEVINPADGTEIFATPQGEARIPLEAFAKLSPVEAAVWQREINRFVADHPKLDVVTMIAQPSDDLVIRWKWR